MVIMCFIFHGSIWLNQFVKSLHVQLGHINSRSLIDSISHGTMHGRHGEQPRHAARAGLQSSASRKKRDPNQSTPSFVHLELRQSLWILKLARFSLYVSCTLFAFACLQTKISITYMQPMFFFERTGFRT